MVVLVKYHKRFCYGTEEERSLSRKATDRRKEEYHISTRITYHDKIFLLLNEPAAGKFIDEQIRYLFFCEMRGPGG